MDQIRCFVAVAEELHFGRAAERLSMTQPPVSRQIKKLESAIGTELLHRNNRSVSLTIAGEALLPRARRILSLADESPEFVMQVANGTMGRLRISFTATSIHSYVSEFLQNLLNELPEVEVRLEEMVTAGQIAALRNEEVDLAFLRPSFNDDPVLESRLVMREPLVLAVPSTDPLTKTGVVTRDNLRGARVIEYSQGAARYFHDLTVAALTELRPTYVQRVTQIHTALALVAAGVGYAVVPRSAEILTTDGVSYVEPEPSFGISVELHAVWRRDHDNAALKHAIDSLLVEPTLPTQFNAASSGSPR